MISRTYYDIYYREEAQQIKKNIRKSEDSDVLYRKQKEFNHSNISNLESIEIAEVDIVENSAVSTKVNNYLVDKSVLGIISIPSIDLIYPVYNGATQEHLSAGVARIDGTSYPVGGPNTNSVIAGHNGFVGRTYFSHISYLKPGDLIEIQNRKELLTYEVYDTAIIDPTDIDALAVIPGQDTLTLLTCTLPAPGDQRYLVFSKRINNKKENQNKLETNYSEKKYKGLKELLEKYTLIFRRYGVIFLIFLSGLIIIYITFIRENNNRKEKK